MSREGMPSVEAEFNAEISQEEAITRGLSMLRALGAHDPVAVGSLVIDMRDPAGRCNGSVAEMLGRGGEGHVALNEGIVSVVDGAVKTEGDARDAVINSMPFFIRRDEEGEPAVAEDVMQVAADLIDAGKKKLQKLS